MRNEKDNSNSGKVELMRLPKLCGADIELGNFIEGLERPGGTGFVASRLLLGEITGRPTLKAHPSPAGEYLSQRQERTGSRKTSSRNHRGGARRNGKAKESVRVAGFNPQDWGRKYLPANGGCAYIDLDHLEMCLPEVLSAYDHVACWHAMLRIARSALVAANATLPPGLKIHALANNSDGQGNSYGSHLNFLVTRRAWNNIFNRKIHYMLYLAAYQASSIIFTGQGKVGSENGAPAARFQISQRADFFETLAGSQTTYKRPFVNSRDEALCGSRGSDEDDEASGMARLHVIFFDNTLSHVASLLKVGVMQIILAMIEAERINPALMLDDPVDAVMRFSHDAALETAAPMASGKKYTAVELQLLFLEEARRFADEGGFDGVVPRADEILALWEDTLLKLESGEIDALAPRLDWVLKLAMLHQVIDERPDLDWGAPQIKHLDQMYSSLDQEEGLYWAYESSGFVERVVTEEQIEHFVSNPPDDTRAWTRAMLLRWADSDQVRDVDWDELRFNVARGPYRYRQRTLRMASPLAFNRKEAEPAFASAATLDELLEALDEPGEEDCSSKPESLLIQ